MGVGPRVLTDNLGNPCTESTAMHTHCVISGAPVGATVVVTMSGPGLPPQDSFVIGPDGSFGKDYTVPSGSGVWTTDLMSINGLPAPPNNAHNKSTTTCVSN
jgi:hypothetical protein